MIRRLLALSLLALGLVVVAGAGPAGANTACVAVHPVLGTCVGVPGAFGVVDDLTP